MKKFVALHMSTPNITKPNHKTTEVNDSIRQIQSEVEIIANEIKEIKRDIRIESKINEDLERQLSEELDKNDAIDKEIEENRKLES